MPEITPLTYEEMLAALLGLLGRHVGFGVEVQVDGQARTLVVLYGELGRGEEADLSPFSGVVEDLPGEAIFFFVDNAYFVVREEDFQFGQRRADTLTFTVGDARFWLTALAEPGDG